MNISAFITHSKGQIHTEVKTGDQIKTLALTSKADGNGSGINGGELLFLALATCYCNDLYREANRRNMEIQSVQVFVSGQFGKEGAPASNIRYRVDVKSGHDASEIRSLITYVDQVAEVHNTLRLGAKVSLEL